MMQASDRDSDGLGAHALPAAVMEAVEVVLSNMQEPAPIALSVGFTPNPREKDCGTVQISDGKGGAFAFGVALESNRAEMLVHVAGELQEHFPELQEAWGQARPRCPRHEHPLVPETRAGEAWWCCPTDRAKVRRIGEPTA